MSHFIVHMSVWDVITVVLAVLVGLFIGGVFLIDRLSSRLKRRRESK